MHACICACRAYALLTQGMVACADLYDYALELGTLRLTPCKETRSQSGIFGLAIPLSNSIILVIAPRLKPGLPTSHFRNGFFRFLGVVSCSCFDYSIAFQLGYNLDKVYQVGIVKSFQLKPCKTAHDSARFIWNHLQLLKPVQRVCASE